MSDTQTVKCSNSSCLSTSKLSALEQAPEAWYAFDCEELSIARIDTMNDGSKRVLSIDLSNTYFCRYRCLVQFLDRSRDRFIMKRQK